MFSLYMGIGIVVVLSGFRAVEIIVFPLTWTSEKAAISFDCCVRSKSRSKMYGMVLVVFYQQGMKHRAVRRSKTISSIFYLLKLLVFVDVEILLIVDVLSGFRLVEIIVFPRISQMRIAAFIV